MVLLGDELSSTIFKYLQEEEIEQLSKAISRIGDIMPEIAGDVLIDYHNLLLAQQYVARGGVDYAKRVLIKSMGPEQAKRIIDRVTKAIQPMVVGFDSLQKADPQQLSKLIQTEHPQTIALVLAHLNATQAAALLSSLPEPMRADVTMRMAHLEQISPEIINRISTILGQKLQSLGDYSRESYGGIRAVAELFNRLDSTISRSVLEQVEGEDPNLALSIRNLMFVFDDILLLDDVAMREILQRVDKKGLAVALKGATEEVRAQFYKNMSARGVEILKEDMEDMGPVKVKDVEAAQQEIVSIIRKLEEEGVLNLKGSGGEEYVA
jgi:flagellar motor switch protein FliG